MVKRLAAGGTLAVAVLLAVSVSQASTTNTKQDQNSTAKTFTGYVMDSACAQMGSHSEMETKHGMKGNDKLSGAAARKCTELCVQNGSQYVLYDPANKMTYQLSDQEKAKQFAGDRVRVRGTYDESSKTITVESISRAGMHGGSSPSSNHAAQ